MLRLKVKTIREGQHPSELVVAVMTADGKQEELIVDQRSVTGNMIDVGYPVGSEKGRLLIELPRETLQGLWRVWVGQEDVISGAAA